jgi:hypothetical protein
VSAISVEIVEIEIEGKSLVAGFRHYFTLSDISRPKQIKLLNIQNKRFGDLHFYTNQK